MPDRLRSLLQSSASQDTKALIINAENYAQKILLQGKAIPWHEATAYANHLGHCAALLKPEVIVISLDKMMIQELIDNRSLITRMTEKTRLGYALKTFMADEIFKKAASNLVTSCTKTLQLPILLQLPSPLQLLYMTANATKPEADHKFDDDDAENAAMYCADWLRAFKETGVDGVIFDEREDMVAKNAYQPIINTAAHYHWCMAVRRAEHIIFSDPLVTIDILPAAYWCSKETISSPRSNVLFTEISSEAIPEQVLELREKLN